MSLYRWADEAKKQFETLKSPGREDYKLEDLRSFYTSFIDRLRNYQRYMYKPLRDLCDEQRQRDCLEHVEKRLRDLRDETRKFFQNRLEIKRLYDKMPPQDRHEFERLAQNLTQDREQQAAGIEGMSPTVGESAG